jgi:hypothetical protein
LATEQRPFEFRTIRMAFFSLPRCRESSVVPFLEGSQIPGDLGRIQSNVPADRNDTITSTLKPWSCTSPYCFPEFSSHIPAINSSQLPQLRDIHLPTFPIRTAILLPNFPHPSSPYCPTTFPNFSFPPSFSQSPINPFRPMVVPPIQIFSDSSF